MHPNALNVPTTTAPSTAATKVLVNQLAHGGVDLQMIVENGDDDIGGIHGKSLSERRGDDCVCLTNPGICGSATSQCTHRSAKSVRCRTGLLAYTALRMYSPRYRLTMLFMCQRLGQRHPGFITAVQQTFVDCLQ